MGVLPSMGVITPSSILSIPMAMLRDHIASCSAFQTWVNEETAQRAKTRVHIVAFDPQTKDLPFAHVYMTDDWETVSIAGGAAEWFETTRSLDVCFQGPIPPELADNADDAMLDFLNHMGAILEDMLALAGQAGYVAINAIRMVDPAWRNDDDEVPIEGDLHGITFRITWGL